VAGSDTRSAGPRLPHRGGVPPVARRGFAGGHPAAMAVPRRPGSPGARLPAGPDRGGLLGGGGGAPGGARGWPRAPTGGRGWGGEGGGRGRVPRAPGRPARGGGPGGRRARPAPWVRSRAPRPGGLSPTSPPPLVTAQGEERDADGQREDEADGVHGAGRCPPPAGGGFAFEGGGRCSAGFAAWQETCPTTPG